jgi:arginyl-tRNA synthetase
VSYASWLGSANWRPGPAPGIYIARSELTELLRNNPAFQSITESNGYLTVTLTQEALARVAVDVAEAGPQCVASDLLHGTTVTTPPAPAAAATWDQARKAVAAEIIPRLAIAAGATSTTVSYVPMIGDIAAAIAFAGPDAVRFWLARGGPRPAIGTVARHALDNPAYAVRYAHAAAAAVLRWAGHPPGDFRPGLLAGPAQRALLDSLSWLPERVAVAARRGRPEIFARYLESLASRTIDCMNTDAELWLALAARTALGAGLDLLGISAPERL